MREIRPAGRNHYKVRTPDALKEFLKEKEVYFDGDMVTIRLDELAIRTERGGNKRISGYKINPLFFVYVGDYQVSGSFVSFDIKKVRQLNPTIAGKIFFHQLNYFDVKDYYDM